MFPEYHCAICKVCLLNVESLMVVYRDTMCRLGCVENMAAPYWGIVLALLITRARINIRVSQYKYDSADQIWASLFIHLHLHTRTVTHSPSPGNCPYVTAAAIYWTTSSVKVPTVCTLHIISWIHNAIPILGSYYRTMKVETHWNSFYIIDHQSFVLS